MDQDVAIDRLYNPNFEEASRQAFVGAYKGVVNGDMEGQLAALYESEILPHYMKDNGHPPETVEDVLPLFEQSRLYQLWGSLVYTSQDLLWETVGQVIDRQRSEFESQIATLTKGNKKGSLTLDPALRPPEPIASTHIHRQPGGYFHQSQSGDLTSALQYFSSIELYRTAKGLSSGATTGEPGMSLFMAQHLRERFPNLQPKRILDMGCGPGTDTLGWAQVFPDAEIHAIDLSEPFLRFAHGWAEAQSVPVHFRQADARSTGYEAGAFDLIVSHILFHETWHDIVPDIMAEAYRILRPGGVFFNADVPYHADRIPMTKRVTNNWQVAYNNEPFWRGFVETDLGTALAQAGFEGDAGFQDYVPLGQGEYFLFGGQKAAA